MVRHTETQEFRGAEFVDVDMSDAWFRDVNLAGARMRGVLLMGADIDGVIDGLVVNGVEVAPLVEAELDRRFPERIALRATTPEGMREAWAVVESLWADTMARARAMPESDLHRSVDEEWSLVQTLRHLIFVIDGWFGRSVLGRHAHYHPLGLPASFDRDPQAYGVDLEATPTFEEVAAVRAERMAQVRDYLATVTQDELDRPRTPDPVPFDPAPEPRTATACLHVLFDEEWAHRQFALRDLDTIAS
jgi:DinB superfamily/Pentapeptide repeats (8 copies)